MGNLTGQVAIISGGLGDIGRACARELARRGADIAVGDRSEDDRVEPLRQEIEQLGRRFRFDPADTADAEAVGQWVAKVEEELGPITLAIPNAAIVEMVDLSNMTPAVWQRHLDVNLSGAFYLAHAVVERLVMRKKPGRIVFVDSWAGPYGASVHSGLLRGQGRAADGVPSDGAPLRPSWHSGQRSSPRHCQRGLVAPSIRGGSKDSQGDKVQNPYRRVDGGR